MPSEWTSWSNQWAAPTCEPPLTTFMLLGPLLNLYRHREAKVVEWRSELYSPTRILNEWGIPTSYLEVINRSTFELFPDNVSRYMNGEISMLIGAGGTTLELGDFKAVVRRLEPRYASFLSPPRLVARTDPNTRIDSLKMGPAAFGDILIGPLEVFCLGGINRVRCGIHHNAMGIRTLGDYYRTAGLEIQPGREGVRQLRTMEQTAGTVISIMTSHGRAVRSHFSHLPPPNPPVVRGMVSDGRKRRRANIVLR